MMTRFTLLLGLSLPLLAGAQVQNGLDFDGTDDEVTVPNASALIANATGFSITCWVKPTSNHTTHRGLIGLRDNTFADFYMLKLQGSGMMEARMRNSTGTAYTANATLQMNTWQHVALVYDGSFLTVYVNGVPGTPVVATGVIASTTGTFHIGSLPYQTDNFRLQGQLDEVSLWSVGLTAAEVACIAESHIDAAATGLQLYYKMDQGVAAGNNSGITSLLNEVGNGDGTITNMALTGATSNFVAGAPLGNPTTGQMCPGGTYTFNGQTLSAPGTYTAVYPNPGGCDSLVSLTLTYTTVNTNVIQSGGNLVSQAVGAQYQWLDCGNAYAEIPGATNAIFDYTTSGSYAVEVTQNGCVDTSSCVTVSTIGLEELQALEEATVRFDAANDLVIITGAAPLKGATVNLYDAAGRMRMAGRINADRTAIATTGLVDGVYFVQISAPDGRRTVRVAVVR